MYFESGALMMQRARSPDSLVHGDCHCARVLVTAPHFRANLSALRSISPLAHL
jgi:hypothetical protein